MPKTIRRLLHLRCPAKRLGTVTAPDRQAAIIKAIERYGIPETSELRLDLVTVPSPKLKSLGWINPPG